MNIAYWSACETDGSDPAGGLQRRFKSSMVALFTLNPSATQMLLSLIRLCPFIDLHKDVSQSITVTSETSVRFEVSCFCDWGETESHLGGTGIIYQIIYLSESKVKYYNVKLIHYK